MIGLAWAFVALVLACVYAICAALINGTDPYAAAAVLLLASAGIAAVHHLEYQRACRRAAGRDRVWARRDREAGA